MKPSLAPRLALYLLVAALLAVGGCAYTTVTAKERAHQMLPPVKAGLRATMAPVIDRRTWSVSSQDNPLPDMRLFSPEISDTLCRELVASGLFAALPAPDEPQAQGLPNRLHLEITSFSLNKLGTNAWMVPHLLLDGVALPVFTGTTIYSKARVDLGGYLLPSNRMGTTVTLRLAYTEGQASLLEKEYSVQEELEQVSEYRYLEIINDASTHGVAMSRLEGRKTLAKLTQTIAGDPIWEFLPQLRLLGQAEQMLRQGLPLDKAAATVEELLPLLDKQLTYLEDETKVLRDGYLDAKARAGIVNDLRARWLGLPANQEISEAGAEQLFDDPKVPRHQVEAYIADRVIILALRIITPPQATAAAPSALPATQVIPPVGFRSPALAVAPEMAAGAARPAPTVVTQGAGPALAPAPVVLPQAQAIRAHISQALAQKVRGDLRLQVLLVQHAEKSVGEAWASMQGLLHKVGAAYTDKYLRTRNG